MENRYLLSRIEDSWDEIIENIKNGTADYEIGEYKALNIGSEGRIKMQIVGKNVSKLADDYNSTASYDFVAMTLLKTRQSMNDTAHAGNNWSKSYLREYLNKEIFPKLPENVRSAIKKVKKLSVNHKGNLTRTHDLLWIPTVNDIFGRYENECILYGHIDQGSYAKLYDTFNSEYGYAFCKELQYKTKRIVGTNDNVLYWLRDSQPIHMRWGHEIGKNKSACAGSLYSFTHELKQLGVCIGFSL